MEKEYSTSPRSTTIRESSCTTRDRAMESCFFSMTAYTRDSGSKAKNMAKESIKISLSTCTMRESGRKARETALDISSFKGKADMKVLFHPITELAMAQRSFQTMIIIKETTNWVSSTEKVHTFGLQAPATKEISMKD